MKPCIQNSKKGYVLASNREQLVKVIEDKNNKNKKQRN